MTGVTPHGIRYPDGASKARNLGPELQQMAEDIDKHIDQSFDYGAIEDAVRDELDRQHVVVAEPRSDSTLAIMDAKGMQLAAIRDTFGRPYLDGSSPLEVLPPTPGDGVRIFDENGMLIWESTSSTGSGGTKVFRETWLIPVVGQSNPMGVLASPIAADTNEPLDNLFMVPQSGSQAGQSVTASDPMAHPRGTAGPGTRSFAIEVGRWLARRNPDVRIVLVPLALSGSGLYYTGGASTVASWAPDREGEAGVVSLYREAITKTAAAAALFTGLVRVPLILWHQGEADSVGEVTAARYLGDATHGLLGIIDGFRAEMPNAANAVFLAGQTVHEFRTIRKPGTWAEIDAAIASLPTRRARVGFAPAPGPGYANPDNTHFTGAGQWLLALSYIKAYQRAVYSITDLEAIS